MGGQLIMRTQALLVIMATLCSSASADPAGVITTVVGTGEQGAAVDGVAASHAKLNNPFDVAFDSNGNLYFSDTFNHCVRRVDARTQQVTTVAGDGTKGFSGDGEPATHA